MKFSRVILSALCIALLMTGCSSVRMQKLASGEAPVVVGPAVRQNTTPMDPAMTCYNHKLAHNLDGRKLQIAVGEIKDYTGKVSETEGTTITQGASLMLFSGLYKLKDSVNIHDRFDMRVTDAELRYIGLRQLGDGESHVVDGEKVPWMPYYGGTIMKSDYTILGGITELNYNISSGGLEFRVTAVGPKARQYVMSIAADLRLVNTQTLEVVSAVSLQKQFVGFEVGFEIFRFYTMSGDSELFDVNIGNKSQEPLQLGIRAIIEESILRLLADATGVECDSCIPEKWQHWSPVEKKRSNKAMRKKRFDKKETRQNHKSSDGNKRIDIEPSSELQGDIPPPPGPKTGLDVVTERLPDMDANGNRQPGTESSFDPKTNTYSPYSPKPGVGTGSVPEPGINASGNIKNSTGSTIGP